jgi:TonB family protein
VYTVEPAAQAIYSFLAGPDHARWGPGQRVSRSLSSRYVQHVVENGNPQLPLEEVSDSQKYLMANTTFLNAIPPRPSQGNATRPHRADECGSQKAEPQPISGLRPKLLYERYGMVDNPFGVTPNPHCLYQSRTHAEARSSLIIGIECGVGFQSLIAPPGMGKTTILFNLLEQFNNVARTAFLFQFPSDSRDFLRYLISDLGGEAADSDLVRMQGTLNQLLIREHRASRQTIVIVDEAQNLDTSVLETLRLLSNFETPTEKLLQIILAGQPQLAQRLASPELAQLYQRISIRTTLIPFDLEDTRNYIEHRLKIAGYQGPPLFTPAALRLILERSGGVPREINTLCFNALLLAAAVKQKPIDSEILREVVTDLDLNPIPFHKDTPPRGVRDVQTADVPQLGDAAADPPATSVDKTCEAAVPAAAEADDASTPPTALDGVDLAQLGTIAAIVSTSREEKAEPAAVSGAKAETDDASTPPTALDKVDVAQLGTIAAAIVSTSREEKAELAAASGDRAEADDASTAPTVFDGVDLVQLGTIAAEVPASRNERSEQAAIRGDKAEADDVMAHAGCPPDRPALTNTQDDRAILAHRSVPPPTREEPDNRAGRIASEHLFTYLLASAYALQQRDDRIRSMVGATKFSEIMAEVINTQSLIRNSMLDSDTAMYLVANRTQRLCGAAGAAIGLLYREELDYKAGTGIAASLLGFKIRADKSVSFGRLKSGQPVETDTRQDPDLAGRVVAKSVLSAPIYQNGELAGCIQLFSRVGEFGWGATHACELMSDVVNLLISAAGAPQAGERDSQAGILEIQKQLKFEYTKRAYWIEKPAILREADAPPYKMEHGDCKTDVVTFAASGVVGLLNSETETDGNSIEIPPFTPEALDASGAELVSPLIRTLHLLNDAGTRPHQKRTFLPDRRWIGAIAGLVIVSSFTLGLMIRSLGKRNSELPSISRTETPREPRTARIPEVTRKHRRTTTQSSARQTIVDDKPAPRTAADKASGHLPNVDNTPTTEENASSVSGSLMSTTRAAGADSRAGNSIPETTSESSARETAVDENPAPGTAVDKSSGKLPNVDTVPNTEDKADSVSESVTSSVPAVGVNNQAGFVENIVPARLISKVKPIYPAAAVEAQIQGSVVLQVLVDKNGAVRDVRSISGPPILAPAAIDAVEHSRFEPCNLNGEPLESEAMVTVKFSLR